MFIVEFPVIVVVVYVATSLVKKAEYCASLSVPSAAADQRLSRNVASQQLLSTAGQKRDRHFASPRRHLHHSRKPPSPSLPLVMVSVHSNGVNV